MSNQYKAQYAETILGQLYHMWAGSGVQVEREFMKLIYSFFLFKQ